MINLKFLGEIKYKGIVFLDIDNTLYDTDNFMEHAFYQTISYMREKSDNSHKFKEFVLEKYYKANSDTIFDEYLKDCNFSQKEIDRLVAYGVLKYHEIKSSMKTYQGVEKFLRKLQNKKYLLGVVSKGLPKKQWEKLIKLNLDHFFHPYLVFLTPNKKDENFYREIRLVTSNLNNLENKDNFWVIGDREDSDIIPSKKSGFKTIKVLTGKYNSKDTDSCADFIFHNIKDIDIFDE